MRHSGSTYIMFPFSSSLPLSLSLSLLSTAPYLRQSINTHPHVHTHAHGHTHRSHSARRQDLMSMKINQLAVSFKQHWKREPEREERGKRYERGRHMERDRERDSSKWFKTQGVCNHLRGRRDVFMWEEKVIIRTRSQRRLLFLCGGCLPLSCRVCRTLHVDWVQVEPSERNKSGVMCCKDNNHPLQPPTNQTSPAIWCSSAVVA